MDKEKTLHGYESPVIELIHWENDVLATGLSMETGGNAQNPDNDWYN